MKAAGNATSASGTGAHCFTIAMEQLAEGLSRCQKGCRTADAARFWAAACSGARAEARQQRGKRPLDPQLAATISSATTWVIPLMIAVTFHEASHGFVARLCGDDTAWRLGRVTFNPFKHIDPFGTVLLPALLLLMHSPFLFGYAKPVPVNFRALRHPRRDSVWVAGAGPAMNLALAIFAALAFHLVAFVPDAIAPWLAANLRNALVINVLLAIFNMLPLPPLDGGRIAVGVLPRALAEPLARLEPYGMMILVGVLFILPLLGAQLGIDLGIVWQLVARSTDVVIRAIVALTGNR